MSQGLVKAQPQGRDLQEHLASRIKQATTGGYNVSSWLGVEVGTQAYLVPLSHASEIFPFTPIHPVPYTEPWFLGIANLRGELTGIADVGLLMGQPAVTRSEQSLQNSKLLTFNPVLEVNAALLIDRLAGLKSVDAFVRAHTADAPSHPYLGTIYQDKEGKSWQELNLQNLAQSSEFLSIRQ